MQAHQFTKYAFRIRTRQGVVVDNLMIHGRDDRTVPMETTLRTAALIPNARAVILNRCGHWAQVEHAAEFDRLVMSFIDEGAGASGGGQGFGG